MLFSSHIFYEFDEATSKLHAIIYAVIFTFREYVTRGKLMELLQDYAMQDELSKVKRRN